MGDLCRETALSQPGKQEEEEEEEEEEEYEEKGEEEEEIVLALCHLFPVLVSSSFVLMLFSPDPEIFAAFKPKFSNSLSSAFAMLKNVLN